MTTEKPSIELSDQPQLKKQKLEESNGHNNGIDEVAIQEAISKIESIEEKINLLEDEQSIEICKLEQKYVERKNPFYKERNQIIAQIPNFWSVAFLQHPQLSILIDDEDEEAFRFLKCIDINQITKDEKIVGEDGGPLIKTLNHSITFEFDENPYFENTSLTKSFFQIMEEIISEGTTIKWKEGKNLVKKSQNKLKNGKAENGAGDSMEHDTTESFFSWFEDHEDAGTDETADIIKDDLYMHALNYYMNEDLEGEEDVDEDPNAEIDLKDSE